MKNEADTKQQHKEAKWSEWLLTCTGIRDERESHAAHPNRRLAPRISRTFCSEELSLSGTCCIFDERTQPMYTIDIDIFCSNVNIHFSSSELMEKIRCIKRLHKSGCSCNYNDTCARDEFTPRFFSRQDIINNNNINTSLATGIELLFYGTIGWIKIPHDQVHASVVATLPWFWPWYNSNDISPLLYPLDAIHDKDFDLSVQINISRRRQYNNQYKFQVQMK